MRERAFASFISRPFTLQLLPQDLYMGSEIFLELRINDEMDNYTENMLRCDCNKREGHQRQLIRYRLVAQTELIRWR